MEYHKIKDILRIMETLGQRDIKARLIHTQLIEFESESDICHSAVANKFDLGRDADRSRL